MAAGNRSLRAARHHPDPAVGDTYVAMPRTIPSTWIVGDEPCVMLDWSGSADYAKPHG